MANPKAMAPVTGATVRLLRDVRTRGKVCFRAGLKMKIAGHSGAYMLKVWVRCKPRYLQLEKKYAHLYFEVVAAAPAREDEDAD